jgi:signal transduction histidine kinase
MASTRATSRISERSREAQRQLEPSNGIAVAALSALEDAIIELDHAGRVVWVNHAGEQMLRASAEEAHGVPLESLLPVVPCGGSVSMYQLLEQGQKELSVWQGLLQRETEPPRDVRVQAVSAATVGASGRAKTLLLVRDMTEQEGLRRQMEFSDRLISLGQLAAGMTHEIGNPLTALCAQAFLLKENLALAEAEAASHGGARSGLNSIAECIAEIEDSLLHIAEVVKGLGDFSKAHNPGAASADVSRVVRWAVRASVSEMRYRGRVAVSAGELPPVALDETRLGQVLLNLLINAARALDPKKFASNLVSVSAFERKSTVVLQVDDTGSGMSPQTVARIFEPFFTTRRDGEGTGLGLSVTSSIIASAGGSIEVESQLGRGSTFRVVLPIAPGSTPGRASRPAHSRPKRVARLLLVDDDERLLTALGQALSVDYSVVCASSGDAALERLRRGDNFDVVVCDVLMLGMTGPALRADVQRLSPGLARSFIFLSGGGHQARELLVGSDEACLQKPVSFAELSAEIERHLSDRPD